MAQIISVTNFKKLPEIPQLAAQNGLHLEFAGLIDPITYPESFLEQVRQEAHYGLYHSAHAPFYDLLPGSNDSEVSDLALRKLKRAVDALVALGIKHLVVHSGWRKSSQENHIWQEISLRFWGQMLDYAKGRLTFYLENVHEPQPDILLELIEAVNDSCFQNCLDLGHVQVFAKGDIQSWIRAVSPYLGHVHLHNNYGKDDEHNGLLEGVIPMDTVLDTLKQLCPRATLNMEIRTQLQASFDYLRGRVAQW